jgi:integrase
LTFVNEDPPADSITKQTFVEYVKYVPPEEDIKKIIMAADPDDMDLIQIIYYTAGRISEVLNLKWEDINFEHNWIRLWTRKRRGGELQEDKLPIGEKLYKILKRRWDKRNRSTPYVFHNEDGTKFTYHQKGHIIKKACEKANVKPFGFHAIRHHVASILADSGKTGVSQVQKFLRHRRSTTTDNYIKTLDPELRQIVKILDKQG